ncbi:MAG: dienelactone hydrolase family protein [Rhodospirillales bacterium]|nr:dienelactone hydrolase family protein [Rhodospirillales bacterium]
MYLNHLTAVVIVSFFVLLPIGSAVSSEIPEDHETVEFPSDLKVSKFWKKRFPDKEPEIPQITAKFRKPEGDGPFPVVILVHGCGGPRSNLVMWADWWAARGYASLAPNSFHARGFSEICTDFERVRQTARVEDVYGAVKYLSTLSIIDTSRIILMGFSNGGGTVMDAVSDAKQIRFEDLPGKIVASIPVYPDCGFHTPPYLVPMLILVGDADDWTPSKLCERHLKMRNNSPTVLKIYPGAHHGFDGDANTFLPNVRNFHSSSGLGATIARNTPAIESSKRDISAFLDAHIK